MIARDHSDGRILPVLRDALHAWEHLWRELLEAVAVLRKAPAPEDRAAAEVLAELWSNLAAASERTSPRVEVGVELVKLGWIADETRITQLLRWSGPGDAHRVKALWWAPKIPPERREAIRLETASWMLDYGTSELRSGPAVGLALELVGVFVAAGDLDQVERALRVALGTDRLWSRDDAHLAHARAALRALATRPGAEDLFEAVVLKFEPDGVESLVKGLLVEDRAHPSRTHPWAERTTRLILGGQLPSAQQMLLIRLLVSSGAAAPVSLPPGCLGAAAEALQSFFRSEIGAPTGKPRSDEVLCAWSRALGRGFAFQPLTGLPLSHLQLGLDRSEAVRRGFHMGVRDALDAAGTSPVEPEDGLAAALAHALDAGPGRGAASALVHLLGLARAPRLEGSSPNYRPLERRLEHLLAYDWSRKVGGLDFTFARDIRRVRIEDLDDAWSIRRDDDCLFVRRASIDGLWRAAVATEEDDAQTLVELFVLHELVHVAQHVAEKSTITALRAHGLSGETTLMHLDLSADHVAACALADARGHDLLRLKDLQGRSLSSFPLGPSHGYGSRYRKSLRLLGARADLLARQAGCLPNDTQDGAYAFCDLGAQQLVVLRNGPPMTRLRTRPITEQERGMLEEVAASATAVEEVDRILGEVFAGRE
jgi:hypothetical protein